MTTDPVGGPAACPCAEFGPLLVAPGTSGRSWRCDTCGRVWSHETEAYARALAAASSLDPDARTRLARQLHDWNLSTLPPVHTVDPDDMHPREDAVQVVARALYRNDCTMPLDPLDADDVGSVASEAVWALIRAGLLDPGEQVSVRQFSCIHGVEPDAWCAQCDPEESARYLKLLNEDGRADSCSDCMAEPAVPCPAHSPAAASGRGRRPRGCTCKADWSTNQPHDRTCPAWFAPSPF